MVQEVGQDCDLHQYLNIVKNTLKRDLEILPLDFDTDSLYM